ncbi:MAG: putative toxin-antitoxin system toxin component, PIN family [Elusimicrobia bacterium]|nr:putative toxin-antitoxin system toxin component, PIN family [Elusimicrobiota bacterium]MBP9128489.1 putative toxin-antitoxin system toxin component, PIN family [Elusimicrobiota bacterium]
MKIILDANVLVSALFGGVPERAVIQAFKEMVYISPRIEAEFQSLSAKLAQRLSPTKHKTWTHVFLPSVLGRCERVGVRRKVDLCRDPKDNAYLSLALEVEADILVTGDKDLLVLSENELRNAGLTFLKILTPRDFLELH